MPIRACIQGLIPCGLTKPYFKSDQCLFRSLGPLQLGTCLRKSSSSYEAQAWLNKSMDFELSSTSHCWIRGTWSHAPLKLSGGGRFQCNLVCENFARPCIEVLWGLKSGWQLSYKEAFKSGLGKLELRWVRSSGDFQQPAPLAPLPTLQMQNPSEVERYRTELGTLQLEKLSEYQDKLRKFESEEVNQYRKEYEQYLLQCNQLDLQYHHYQEQVEPLQLERQRWNNEQKAWQQAGERYQSNCQQLQSDLAAIRARQEEIGTEKGLYEVHLAALDRDYFEFRWDFYELLFGLPTPEAVLEPYRYEIENFEATYGLFDEQKQQLQREYNAFKRPLILQRLIQYEQLQEGCEALKTGVLNLQAQFEQLRLRETELGIEIERAGEEDRKLEIEVLRLENTHFELVTQGSEIREKTQSLEAEWSRLEAERFNLQAGGIRLEIKSGQLQQASEALKVEHQSLAQRHQHLEAEFKRLQPELLESTLKKAYKNLMNLKPETPGYTLAWNEVCLPNYQLFNQLYLSLVEAYQVRVQQTDDLMLPHKLSELEDISEMEAEAIRISLAYEGFIFPWVCLERIFNFFGLKIQEASLDRIKAVFTALDWDLDAWDQAFLQPSPKFRCIEKTAQALQALHRHAGYELINQLIVESIGISKGPHRAVFHTIPEVQSSLTWLLYLHFHLPTPDTTRWLENLVTTFEGPQLSQHLDYQVVQKIAITYRGLLRGEQLAANAQFSSIQNFLEPSFQRKFAFRGSFLHAVIDLARSLAGSEPSITPGYLWTFSEAERFFPAMSNLVDYFCGFPVEAQLRASKVLKGLKEFKAENLQGTYLRSNLTELKHTTRVSALEQLKLGIQKAQGLAPATYWECGKQQLPGLLWAGALTAGCCLIPGGVAALPWISGPLSWGATGSFLLQSAKFLAFRAPAAVGVVTAWKAQSNQNAEGRLKALKDAPGASILDQDNRLQIEAHLPELRKEVYELSDNLKVQAMLDSPIELEIPLPTLFYFKGAETSTQSTYREEAQAELDFGPLEAARSSRAAFDLEPQASEEGESEGMVVALPHQNALVYYGGFLPEYTQALQRYPSSQATSLLSWRNCFETAKFIASIYMRYYDISSRNQALDVLRQTIAQLNFETQAIRNLIQHEVLTAIHFSHTLSEPNIFNMVTSLERLRPEEQKALQKSIEKLCPSQGEGLVELAGGGACIVVGGGLYGLGALGVVGTTVASAGTSLIVTGLGALCISGAKKAYGYFYGS